MEPAWPQASDIFPALILDEAAEGLVGACESLLGVTVEASPCADVPFESCAAYSAAVSCTHADGGWNIIVAGDQASCVKVASLMFGDDMAPGDSEIGDALGELANITAGILKTRRAKQGQMIQIGLPLAQVGDNCCRFIGHGVKTASSLLSGPDLQVQVVLVWREG